MKTLAIFAHPNIDKSRVSRAWRESLQNLTKSEKNSSITIKTLCEDYPDWKINVQAEQKALEDHDLILIVAPVYWYSVPALLKKWYEDIFTYNWAYGDKYSLENKKVKFFLSVGADQESYTAQGFNRISVDDFFSASYQTLKYLNMKPLPTFLIHGTNKFSIEEVKNSATKFENEIKKLLADSKSNASTAGKGL